MEKPQPETDRQHVVSLCRSAFGADGPTVKGLSDVNQGRGAFSVVLRAELHWPDVPAAGRNGATAPAQPTSVVAKLPVDGPNGEAAVTSGAYVREALAYRELLSSSTIASPAIHWVAEPGDGTCSLLMEDLSDHRSFDQLVGLPSDVAVLVAGQLRRFHRGWADDRRLLDLPVRRNTIAGLPADALAAGLDSLTTTWGDELTESQVACYRRLLARRPQLIERFEQVDPTLCHGDPRADNFVLDDEDRVVLFDWQQMAIQFGEADLAWMSATSIETDVRRRIDQDMIAAYGGSIDHYRLGLALPGLTVLLLAQRELHSDRTRRFVAASLKRIAAALDDLDVPAVV